MTSTLTTREMAELYKAGNTTKIISQQCGLSSQAVHYRLKKSGVSLRRRGRRTAKFVSRVTAGVTLDQSSAKFEKDYKSGMSLRAIGKKYGVSYESIRNNLNNSGVPLRDKGGKGFKTVQVTIPVKNIKTVTAMLDILGVNHSKIS